MCLRIYCKRGTSGKKTSWMKHVADENRHRPEPQPPVLGSQLTNTEAGECNSGLGDLSFHRCSGASYFLFGSGSGLVYRCPSHLGTNAHFALLLPDAFGLVDHGTA
jgi:hypothetical protein